MNDTYIWIRLIHIVSSTLLFGAGIGTAFHMYMTHKRGNVSAIASATRNTIMADWLFIATSGIVQLVSGLMLVKLTGFGYLESWLIVTYILYVITGACWGKVVQLQYRVCYLAESAVMNQQPLPADYYSCMRWWFILGWPAFISLLIIFVLMVLKPSLW